MDLFYKKVRLHSLQLRIIRAPPWEPEPVHAVVVAWLHSDRVHPHRLRSAVLLLPPAHLG